MRRPRRGRAWRRVQLLGKGFVDKLRRMYIRVARLLQRVFLSILADYPFFFCRIDTTDFMSVEIQS